ncbi:MAG: late competence development ComFB family protein [Halieaceae bacterium]|jgi:hypothetical protein|nr:late competence development ComFB family protein [Halieaceae bacterium]
MNNPANIDTDTFDNYYESLVLHEVGERQLHKQFDEGTVLDIICTALNQLPARYIRHPINLYFYSSQAEQDAMALKASEAVDYALTQVAKRQ